MGFANKQYQCHSSNLLSLISRLHSLLNFTASLRTFKIPTFITSTLGKHKWKTIDGDGNVDVDADVDADIDVHDVDIDLEVEVDDDCDDDDDDDDDENDDACRCLW